MSERDDARRAEGRAETGFQTDNMGYVANRGTLDRQLSLGNVLANQAVITRVEARLGFIAGSLRLR
jgi:hypothetical protein